MSRLTSAIKGVGVLDPYWRYDRLHTDTDVSEAEPKPGTASTSDTYATLAPQMVGVQTKSLSLQCVHSGLPGLGFGIGERAEIGYWLTDTETSADIRYLDQPTKVHDWHKPTSPTNTAPDSSDAVTYPISGRTALYWFDSTGVGANNFAVWNPYTRTYENSQALSGRPHSAFAVVPGTERLIRVSIEGTGNAGNEYSDDYGATWVTYTDGNNRPYSPNNVGPSPGSDYRQLRAAYDGAGNLMLMGIDAATSDMIFWASADNGVTWEYIASSPTPTVLGADMAQLPDGTIGILYTLGLSGVATFVRVGSAYDDPTGDDAISVDAFGTTTAFAGLQFQSFYLGVDAAGVIWAWAENSVDDGAWAVAASRDGGTTWFSDWYLTPKPYFWSWGVTAQRPTSFRFAPRADGGFIVAAAFGEYGAGVGTGGVLEFGQWRQSPIDPKVMAKKDGTDVDRHWVGYIRPEDGPVWTKTGTATTSLSTGGNLNIVSTAGALAGHYSAALSVAGRTENYVEFGVVVNNDGGSNSGIGVEMTTKFSAGNKRSNVRIYLQTNGYRVWDNVAGTFLGAKVSVDLTAKVHFEMHVDTANAEVVTVHREDGATTTTRTVWSGLTTGATLLDGSEVDWGQLNGVANASSSWAYVQASAPPLVFDNVRIETGLSAGFSEGYPIPDARDDAAERTGRLVSHGGWAAVGETYELPAAPDYPLRVAFPDAEPSPDRRWRSSETGVAQDIAVDRGSDATAGSYTVALLVMGVNCRTWGLAAKEDGGSSYTSLGTLDLAAGFAQIGYSRVGQVVVPGTGTAGSRYVQDGECDGGHIIFDPAGTPVTRRIRSTVAGFPDATATGPRTVWLLDDIDGTEPTSGDMTVVWPSGVMVVHLSGAAANMRRYLRVRCFATNNSPDDYYSAGVIGVFGLRAYGKDWGNGWEIDQAPNVASIRDTYGTERRKKMGPDARTLTKSWDHGVKLDRTRGQSDADYIGAVGAAALAARDEVWQRLVGIWRDTDQGSQPALVLMADPGSGNTLTDPTKWLYGYPDGSVRVQHALGQDDAGFYLRAGPVRFVEIK